MRQAAAERAAIADRIMRDVTHHVGQKLSQRSFANRPMECGVTNAGADDKFAADDGEPVKRLDAVDIDEVRGLGEPKRHSRDEALAAGEDAAVLGGKFGKQRDRFVDRFRRVIAEGGRLHRAMDAPFTGGSQSPRADVSSRRSDDENSSAEYYHPASGT